MTLDELKQEQWYKDLPEIIKLAVDIKPPIKTYYLDGKGCVIRSYAEPTSNKLEDVTVTVIKTGEGQGVFGVKLNDLKEN